MHSSVAELFSGPSCRFLFSLPLFSVDEEVYG
jgi:hypothetical protein